jgi:hypothetical protein
VSFCFGLFVVWLLVVVAVVGYGYNFGLGLFGCFMVRLFDWRLVLFWMGCVYIRPFT